MGLAATLMVALGALGALGAPKAGSVHAVSRARSPAAPHTSAPLVLDGQSEWVLAPAPARARGSAQPSTPFDLGITAHDAPSGAQVRAVLYPRLSTRFSFKNVVRSGPRGDPLAETLPVSLASLPPDPRARGGVSFDLSVVQAASSGQANRIGLACAPPTGTGTCTGVYPVVVELLRSTGRVLHRFTTFLTYVAAKSAHRLEFAWIVPLDSPVSISANPSGPADALRPLARSVAASLETLVSQLRAATSVPLTLDVSPETLQALERAGPGGRAADAAIAAMSTAPTTDQILTRPYVPIDLGALAGAGEPTEIVAQMAAGATVLDRLHVSHLTGPSPWVQPGPVGNDIAKGLEELHATEFVLPGTDLAPTPGATDSGTWASTFSLVLSDGGSKRSVKAAEADGWLDGQFTAVRDDPALAASQVLADLAMVHFERPNTAAVRGMVALPPAQWTANPIFDRVLLDGLSKNPVVEPVTLTRYFASVTAQGTRRLLEPGPGPVLRHSLAEALSRARVRLSDFDGSIAGHPAVLSELDDLLLACESENLAARQQVAGVSDFERLLGRQLRLVRFATKTFTLTARTGWIPITVDKRAPYTVVGILAVSGNKFLFPHRGSRRPMRLDHATNATRVDVLARSSGDLPLHVTFTSPNGRLVIARGLLTVRSTATSLVGIVLTAVALVVLLSWWARTWWSRRQRRRRARASGSRTAGA